MYGQWARRIGQSRRSAGRAAIRIGISATPQRRQVSVMGPIWPTASRPTIEWPAQIRVVRTRSRIGLAHADCMSPDLGAVASVMKLFGGLWRILRSARARQGAGARATKREAQDAIGRAAAEGNPRGAGRLRAEGRRPGFQSLRTGGGGASPIK